MAKYGPQSELEIKFAAINRTTDYAAKRLLIEALSNAERAAYNAQMQNRFSAVMPTFTPAAELFRNLNSVATVQNATQANIGQMDQSDRPEHKSHNTKPSNS